MNNVPKCRGERTIELDLGDILLSWGFVNFYENKRLHRIYIKNCLDKGMLWIRKDLCSERFLHINLWFHLNDCGPDFDWVINVAIEVFTLIFFDLVFLSLNYSNQYFFSCWQKRESLIIHLSNHIFLRLEINWTLVSPVVPRHPLKVSLINEFHVESRLLHYLTTVSNICVRSLSVFVVRSLNRGLFTVLRDYDISIKEDLTHLNTYILLDSICFVLLVFCLKNHANNTIELFLFHFTLFILLEICPSPVDVLQLFEDFKLICHHNWFFGFMIIF